MAARVPSAGIHLVFFGFTITQLSPVGALHAVDLRASFDRRNQEDDIMNCRSLLTMTPIGIIGFCAIDTAKADEVLKFRLVMHATYVQSQEVGDVAA